MSTPLERQVGRTRAAVSTQRVNEHFKPHIQKQVEAREKKRSTEAKQGKLDAKLEAGESLFCIQ